MDQEVVEELRQLLLGAQCESVAREDGNLRIHFVMSNIFIACAWRLSRLAQMGGSGSKVEDLDELIKALKGLRINGIEVIGDFNDLRIRFDGQFLLETFADAGNYENWTIKGRDVQMIISGPGKLWSCF